MRVLSSLALLLLLAGCEPQAFCPYIRQYSPALQQQALKELQALPKGSALRQFMGDYGALRDQVRACQRGP